MASLAPNVSRLRPPPSHLGPEGRALWLATLRDYAIDSEPMLVHLDVVCTALDRLTQCRKVIEDEGLVLTDRKGDKLLHPAAKAESAARAAFQSGMRALRLQPSTAEPTNILKPGRR
jgi:phage terminase small subunit